MTPLDVVTSIAVGIPKGPVSATPKRYRDELKRRLTLRGWTLRQGMKLDIGSRGDDTHYRCKMDLLAYPPDQTLPVIIELERRSVTRKTRAKLRAWGSRDNLGKLVLVLYAKVKSERTYCPEAVEVLTLSLIRQTILNADGGAWGWRS